MARWGRSAERSKVPGSVPVSFGLAPGPLTVVPLTLVVLGAFFYAEPSPVSANEKVDTSNPPARGAKAFFERKLKAMQAKKPAATAYPGENRTVFVAVVSRMILTPMVLLPVVALLAKYDPFEAARDPVFVLAATLLIVSVCLVARLTLLTAQPPALTLAQITQAGAGDKFERLISKTISWSYAVLTPP